MSSEAIGRAITSALGDEGELTTKWLLIAEVIGPDGDRALRTVANPEAMSWDVLGMLHWAVAQEGAAQ